jgi:hypothetical protein
MSTPNLVMMGMARYTVSDPVYGNLTYWVNDFGFTDDGTDGGGGGGGGDTCPAGMECNTNRPGGDFYGYPNPNEPHVPTGPEDCQYACQQDSNCQAWTYVKPGIMTVPGVQGSPAFCWEKNSVPAPVQDACCTSGVKTGGPLPTSAPSVCSAGSICDGVNLPGSDIYHYPSEFDPAKSPDPSECKFACDQDPNCKSWSWVKPGIQGPDAVCWLKGAVPTAERDSCCTSGAKTSFSIPGGPQPTQPQPTQGGGGGGTGPVTVGITVDKGEGSTYFIDDPIKTCYTVSRSVYVKFIDTQGGVSTTILEGLDDGAGVCFDARMTPPTGR